MDLVATSSLIAIIACSVVACQPGKDQRRLPVLTLFVAALLALCLLAQLTQPALLSSLRRDAEAIRSGEWYRLLTSLVVQDHWLNGGVFNITIMMVVGRLAEDKLGRVRWLLLAVGGGMLTELLAMRLQPIGAGNSIAYMSLSGGVLICALPRTMPLSCRLAGATGLAIAALLGLRGDIHGAAVAVGAALTLIPPGTRRKPSAI